MTKKISVIIPAYNEEAFLPQTLQALSRQTFARHDFEIIVIDNASSDRTSEMARIHGADMVLYESRKGTNRARQTGLEACSGRIVAFIDADCIPPIDWLEQLQGVLNKNRGRVVAVAGSCKFHQNKIQVGYVFEELYRWIVLPAVGSIAGHVFKKGGVILGGNFASFKKNFDKINGFDTSKTFFGDDASIARDLGRLGIVKFEPRLYVWSSPRRFEREGLLRTNLRYTMHYIKVMMEK